jgi:tyrosinase
MAGDESTKHPAVPPPVRVRRDVHRLAENDPIIVYYERAIKKMSEGNRIDLATSWRYQAAIHSYPATVATATDPAPGDPNSKAGEKTPSATEQTRFWRVCEHGSWFFLVWHRMYLHFFEKLVAKIVADLGGPKQWALPYWNYSRDAESGIDNRKLPMAFQRPQIADEHDPKKKRQNFLFISRRVAEANSNGSFLEDDDVDLGCLQSPRFDVFEGTQRHHHPLGTGGVGAVENVPHNAVHGSLGGATGLMNTASFAPLDPMFWLHHSNIDRLWDIWVQRQKGLGNLERNPDLVRDGNKIGTDAADLGRAVAASNAAGIDAATKALQRDKDAMSADQGWLDTTFDFHDENGNPAKMACKDVLNSRVAPLSYEYEDISDPFHGAPN